MNTLKNFIKRFPFAVWAYRTLKSVSAYNKCKHDFNRFSELIKEPRFKLSWQDLYPCPDENTSNTNFDRHYVYHTAWAARILKSINPEFHTDISSSLYFVSIVSAFLHVRFYDFRPPELKLSNLDTKHADLSALHFKDASVKSLSCMHVVEHIGLGRYGDPLSPDGDLKAIAELKRVLAQGGSLLFVVPIGKPKIMFNAHRIYSYEQIINYFQELDLKEFTLIPDDGPIIYNASKEISDRQTYGCGCFWFVKNQ